MRYKLPAAPFYRLGRFLLLLFVFTALGAGYWGFVRAPQLSAEYDFARQIERALSVDRGRIFAADGTVLAETRFNEQGDAERLYSYPGLATVTGHWTLVLGRTGIENAFNGILEGSQGQRGLHVFDELRHEQVVGADVVTTIRMPIQQAADQALGSNVGAVVVLDPATGAVLASASHPFYDPNSYAQNAEAIVADPAQPLLNRVTRGLYTPGSVYKVVTLLGALAQGETTLDERFPNENGIFIVNGFPVRDGSDLPVRNAPYDLAHALAYSSNVTFAQLGLRIGPDGMREIGGALGFGEAPPFELTTEPSRLGSDTTLLDQVGLATTAFGQGELLVTPLQMALVGAAVANEGTIMQPYLVQSIRDRAGNALREVNPRPWKRAVEPAVAEAAREAMVISARDGFARAGAPPGIAIGGKTGTAQLGGSSEPHAWFLAFAPADDPQIVVAVVVENGGRGGDIAAPIAAQVIQAALSGQ